MLGPAGGLDERADLCEAQGSGSGGAWRRAPNRARGGQERLLDGGVHLPGDEATGTRAQSPGREGGACPGTGVGRGSLLLEGGVMPGRQAGRRWVAGAGSRGLCGHVTSPAFS